MKKKVLFIVGTLQSGGVSKSMVSLLNAWDTTKYETDLLLCCKEGDIYSPHIPHDVRIIYDPVVEHVMGGVGSIKWLLLHGKLCLAFGVLLRLVLSKISKSKAGELIARMMPVVSNEEYDLIVDYGGQQQLYYMVDKLHGKRKVTFFHNDYSKWPYYYPADKLYFPRVDHIFSVSSGCVEVLKRYFPECAEKISEMANISSPGVIQELAKEPVDLPRAELLLCTLGHFCRRKGSDFAIGAAEILKKRGFDFKWIFVGKVIEHDLLALVKDKGLDDYFIFTGIQSNPYPYVLRSNIYVHPSRFEGKSIALDEAKILCKPIVVTNFSTACDQFEAGVNATVCEMNGRSLAESIITLYNDPRIQQRYAGHLQKHIVDNTAEVEKLYRFI